MISGGGPSTKAKGRTASQNRRGDGGPVTPPKPGGGRAANQNGSGTNCNDRGRRVSGSATEAVVPTPIEPPSNQVPASHAEPAERVGAVARTSMAILPCSPEPSYAQLAQSAVVRGSSRERGLRVGGTARGLRAPTCSSTSCVNLTSLVTAAGPGAPQAACGQEPPCKSHWEEFTMHRHEMRLKLETLMEARESQRLTDARTHMQMDQLSGTVQECVEDCHLLREQSETHTGRLDTLDRALQADQETLETIRCGLSRLECALRERVAHQDQRHEAMIVTLKRGDRAVADELLLKMAELNEKLGANMQALEEEITEDLQSVAARVDRTIEQHQCRCNGDNPHSVEIPSSDHAHARLESFMLEAKEELKAAVSRATELSQTGSDKEDFADSLTEQLTRQRERLEELDAKIVEQIATCKATMARESLTCNEKLQQNRSELRDACRNAEMASASAAHGVREELHARFEEAKNSREDLAETFEETIQAMREEMRQKMHSHVGPPSDTEALKTVRDDMNAKLDETQKAHEGLVILVEDTSREVDAIRAQVKSGVDETRGACSTLAAAVDKAVCGVRDELTAKIDVVGAAHEQFVAQVDGTLRSIREERPNCADVVTQRLREEFVELENACQDNCLRSAARLDEITETSSKIQADLSAEHYARLQLEASLRSFVHETKSAIDQSLIDTRSELETNIEQSRADWRRLENTLETSVLGTKQELQTAVEGVVAERLPVAAEQEDALQCNCNELNPDSEKVCGRCEQNTCSRVLCPSDLESKFDEVRQQCECNRDQAQREVEAVRQRVQQFCEEIIEMVTDLNNQACGGCIEVQQSLEVAMTPLNAFVAETQLRLHALETQPALLSSPAAVDDSLPNGSSVPETSRRLEALEARSEAVDAALHQHAERIKGWLEAHSGELAAIPISLHESRGQIRALEEHVNATCSSLRRDCVNLEADLSGHGTRLESISASLDKLRTQLDMSEARLEEACKAAQNTSISSSPIRLERQFEASGCEFSTSPTTFSEAQGQLAAMEERWDATHESSRRQIASLDSRVEDLTASVRAWPTTIAGVQSQLSSFEERLEEMSRNAARREATDLEWLSKVEDRSTTADSMSPPKDGTASRDRQLSPRAEMVESALESLVEKVDNSLVRLSSVESGLETVQEKIVCFPEHASLGGEPSPLLDRFIALEEQLDAVQQAISKDRGQVERRFELHVSDCVSLRRAIGDLTNDVLKTQGAADAAYAEATRGQEWVSAMEASNEAMRKQWRRDLEKNSCELKAGFEDMIQGVCDKVLRSISEEVEASTQKLRHGLHHECRRWTEELANNTVGSEPATNTCDAVASKILQRAEDQQPERTFCQTDCQDVMRTELEKVRSEAQVEFERVWEAIGAQAGGATERSEALALETQQQCRALVDGALRKLEDLALRTKERISALGAAAERREERLEARLETELRRLSTSEA